MVESATSPEMFLVVLAVSMCSILFCFTIGVVVIFHCCDVKEINFNEIPAAVLERTRHSINWARNSIFSSHSECIEEEIEDHNYLSPHRAFLKTPTPTPVEV